MLETADLLGTKAWTCRIMSRCRDARCLSVPPVTWIFENGKGSEPLLHGGIQKHQALDGPINGGHDFQWQKAATCNSLDKATGSSSGRKRELSFIGYQMWQIHGINAYRIWQFDINKLGTSKKIEENIYIYIYNIHKIHQNLSLIQ